MRCFHDIPIYSNRWIYDRSRARYVLFSTISPRWVIIPSSVTCCCIWKWSSL